MSDSVKPQLPAHNRGESGAEWSAAVPPIVTPARADDAVSHLRRYFAGVTERGGWTGSRFERMLGGGDAPETRDHFTAADLVAVTMLSVTVPPRAALELLESRAEHFSELLAAVPADVELVDVDVSAIDEEWPAWRLWTELTEVAGVGWVTAGKLLARKRPHLIPVYDKVIRDAVRPAGSFWVWLASALNADSRALHRHLVSLRDQSGIGDDISVLRVFDVAVWMEYRGGTT